MNRHLRAEWPWMLLIALLLSLYMTLPIGSAVEFGGDEGFELTKGFLCSRGFLLYRDVWSDQPPLFPMIFSLGFKSFGVSLAVSRVIAATFGLVLIAAIYGLIKDQSNHLCAWLTAFFLLASPGVLLLSVSVMQEVPAFSVAMVSVLLIFEWRKRSRWEWLLASGLVMGIALQIKFTVALVLPAMLIELVLKSWEEHGGWSGTTKILRSLLPWGGGGAVTFALIAFFLGQGSLETSWRAHFGAHQGLPIEGDFGSPNDFPLPAHVFWDHLECIVAGVLGLGLTAIKRKCRTVAFPIGFLATALLVHFIHRPWWGYYYLHLAIPMSWLAGIGMGEIIPVCSHLLASSGLRAGSSFLWKGVALCLLSGLVLVRSELRLEGAVKDIRQRPPADSNPFVRKMKEYAPRTHWVYAQRPILAFHARLPLPPKLAVVSLKMFWSGQMSRREIVDICRRYRTEQVLLNAATVGDEWRDFLKDFDIVLKDQNFVLYVSKAIERP